MIMGLENGLVVRAKSYKGDKFLEDFASKYQNFEFDTYDSGYELAYWRKCSNVRNVFMNAFEQIEDGNGGILNIADLYTIKQIMISFLSKRKWNENGGSIWSWEQSLSNTAKIIYLVTELIEDINNVGITDDDIEIEFYDSY